MDHLLDDLPSGWAVVCVGEERATTRPVRWRRESPAGGGPVAAIAAGLDYLERHDLERHDLERDDLERHDLERHDLDRAKARICVVVGGDMPFAAPAVPRIVAALNAGPGLDAVLAADPDGRLQPLLAAYRCGALRAALPPEPGGARLMSVVGALVTGTVTCEAPITLDVDTPGALEQARRIVGD